MATENVRQQSEGGWSRWQDWVNLIVGVWMFASPWMMKAESIGAARNAWVVGAAIVVLSLWALLQPSTALPERLNALAGVWLVVAPWVLRFHHLTLASSNAWICGILVILLSVWAAAPLQGGSTYTPGKPIRS